MAAQIVAAVVVGLIFGFLFGGLGGALLLGSAGAVVGGVLERMRYLENEVTELRDEKQRSE